MTKTADGSAILSSAMKSTTSEVPNAWRIYDPYGEHVATVYEADMLAEWLAKDGYTAVPVRIRDPRW